MATPNYSYEKRQRELAKKRKTEEKRMRKVNKPEGGDASEQEENAAEGSSNPDTAADPAATAESATPPKAAD